MTFDLLETSVESAEPLEIYEIVTSSQVFRFTSSQGIVTVGGVDYTPVDGLQRTTPRDGSEEREHDFSIELPTSNALAQMFIGVLPGTRFQVAVSRLHRPDLPAPEVLLIFDGFIHSATFRDRAEITTLTCRPALASTSFQIPRRTYQAACNHILYNVDTCTVDNTDPQFRAASLSVASQVGNILTVTGLSSQFPIDGTMNSGYVETLGGTTDFRSITDHIGNDVALLSPFSVTPTTVHVHRGCGHNWDFCNNTFDNGENFGGANFVPRNNPFKDGID